LAGFFSRIKPVLTLSHLPPILLWHFSVSQAGDTESDIVVIVHKN
jgi:hypothetical protein